METFCLRLHYKGANSYLFVNGKKLIRFWKKIQKTTKDFEIVAAQFCLGSISKVFFVDNLKNTGLNWYDYDFIVDYDAIKGDDISYIHKYFMKKNKII